MDYHFKTQPFAHQLRVWEESRDLATFALFWEQGTGKTKAAIDSFCYLYLKGEIDGVIVVAPNGVHRNWVSDELPAHVPCQVRYEAMAYRTESHTSLRHKTALDALIRSRGQLSVLTISYDGWMTKSGKKAVWDMMKQRRCMVVLDEAHRIKTPGALRTRSIVQGGVHAKYRRILTGTPVTQGPFDVFSQVRFLDQNFWRRELNIDTFAAFKAYFGVWQQEYNSKTEEMYDVLVGYQNLDELSAILRRISSRVLKRDALDLPPKLYKRRYYEMTPRQREVYRSLESDFEAWLSEGRSVTAPLAITRMLRLQQVLNGYVPVDGEDEPTQLIHPTENPKLRQLVEAVEDSGTKSILWATWTLDIDLIMEALRDAKRRPVRYDGTVSNDEREEARDRFKRGDATDFVANSQMSEGLTLNEGKFTGYYSNSYKMLDRKQTEDRNHRIGQDESVTYMDFICAGTRDEAAIEALVAKHEVASVILGDKLEHWM